MTSSSKGMAVFRNTLLCRLHSDRSGKQANPDLTTGLLLQSKPQYFINLNFCGKDRSTNAVQLGQVITKVSKHLF